MPIKQIRSVAIGQKFRPGAHEKLLDTPPGTSVDLVREPDNKFDPNAIAVKIDGQHCGYIPRAQAELLARDLDAGRLRVAVLEGYNKLVIDIEIDEPAEKESTNADAS